MTLTDFLVYLTGGGSVVALSFIMERIEWFKNLTSEAKQWVMFIGCSVISCGAFAIQQYVPKEILNQFAPYFGLLASIFVATFIAKAFHKVDKKDSATPVPVVVVDAPVIVDDSKG